MCSCPDADIDPLFLSSFIKSPSFEICAVSKELEYTVSDCS